jgi:sodium-dependent dicarboxylate transporter 2/3/5
VLAGVMETLFGVKIGFGQWFLFGFPLALVMFTATWLYLTRLALPSEFRRIETGDAIIRADLQALGPMSVAERWVFGIFIGVAALWLFKDLIPIAPIRALKDSVVAMLGALLLFVIPLDLRGGVFLLDWKSALRVPWEVIILFGGGFALAHGFEESGLTLWIGNRMAFLSSLHWVLIILGITAVTIFLTEVTSNTATASMLLPIIAGICLGLGIHPFGPMVGAALAASFAFMLPVATPPNAIVYASGRISIPQMARIGLWLNLGGMLLILAFVSLLLPRLWGFTPDSLPADLQPAESAVTTD